MKIHMYQAPISISTLVLIKNGFNRGKWLIFFLQLTASYKQALLVDDKI